tara:strand:+ start:190 stop:555 length:366 start_codon:yes stop_codon:yes gene_type:complete
VPIFINGTRPNVRFTCDEDVWHIIDLIIEETIALNSETKKEFDVVQSVKTQLPFFACSKAIYCPESQTDIERYFYCKEFGIQPYPGTYEDQPVEWIKKVFIIKSALNKKEKEAHAKAKNNS